MCVCVCVRERESVAKVCVCMGTYIAASHAEIDVLKKKKKLPSFK